MLRWNRNKRGFTLVELVIVIAILGILALYALPKYQGLIKEARSSEARAQLGAVRSAIGIYYAKNHGVYPSALDGTIFADGTVPEVEVTVNGSVVRSNAVATGNGNGVVEQSDVTNTGGWVYDVNSNYTKADVRINSTDEDPDNPGTYWYQY
jgi:prepilin-type N-terminal cleavage/methylation domain-containing protein